MGAYSGTAYNPHNGQNVKWTLASVLAACGKDLDKIGITWYSIGNSSHLQGQGGHTPWKPGAPYGTVTAIDIMKSPYDDVEKRVLDVLKSNFDTTWIDFVNTNYEQYDYDGDWQADSGDGHWHLETLPKKTGGSTILIQKVWPEKFTTTPPQPTTPKGGVMPGYTLVQVRGHDAVFKAENGTLQHVSRAQRDVLQKELKSNGARSDVFVMDTEEQLAAFGTVVVPQTTKVDGLTPPAK
jgi:hypothetical protein